MNFNRIQKYVVYFLFIGLTLWWAVNNYFDFIAAKDLWSDIYGVMAVCGLAVGIWNAKKWGGIRNNIGRAILLFSFGLLCQEFGQLVYSYNYRFHGIYVSCPSLGDVGFFLTVPLYIAGIYFFSKASNCNTIKWPKRIFTTMIIFAVVILFYHLFLNNAGSTIEGGAFRYLLGAGYIIGGFSFVSLALYSYLISSEKNIGTMKSAMIAMVFALAMQFLADAVFIYQVNMDSWISGGANELMYLSAYFLMALTFVRLGYAIENTRVCCGKFAKDKTYFYCQRVLVK